MDEICYEVEVKYQQNPQILINPQHLARIMLLEQSASQGFFWTDWFFFSKLWKSVFWVSDGQISGMLVQCLEHPKRDLALNDDKFLEPVQKMLKAVTKKCGENFPQKIVLKKFDHPPKTKCVLNFPHKKMAGCYLRFRVQNREMLPYVSIGSQQYGRIIEHFYFHICFLAIKSVTIVSWMTAHWRSMTKPDKNPLMLNVQIIQITWMNTTGATPQIWDKYPDDGVLCYITKLEHKGKKLKSHTLVQSLPLGVGTRD